MLRFFQNRSPPPAPFSLGRGFMRQSGDIDNAFAEWVIQTDASLDWIFFERGLPFMSNARYLGRVEMVESGGLDSMFSSVAPALKRGRSKAP